jgi:hypothetical protein
MEIELSDRQYPVCLGRVTRPATPGRRPQGGLDRVILGLHRPDRVKTKVMGYPLHPLRHPSLSIEMEFRFYVVSFFFIPDDLQIKFIFHR